MIVENIEQGSEEWFKARAGIPTASNFDKIVTSQGLPSKQALKYMYKLAGERIIGKKEATHQTEAMTRGIEMEEEARNFYELVTGNKVEQVGFCYPDEDKKFGCSPDGLVGKNGLIEIKCPLLHTMVEYLLENKLPTTYIQQVQGQLLVTGRKWCDFVAYYPDMKPLIIRVNRDEVFISKLQKELKVFNSKLEMVVANLKDEKIF